MRLYFGHVGRVVGVTAVAAALLAAGAVVLGAHSSSDRAPAVRSATAQNGHQDSPAVTLAAMRQALTSTGGEIFTSHTTVTKNGAIVLDQMILVGPNGTTSSETWAPSGAPLSMETVARNNGKAQTQYIDFVNHRWWTANVAKPIIQFDPKQVINDLQTGGLHVAGKEVIDGRPELKLTGQPASMFELTVTVYVDPTTYLPISSVSDQAPGVDVEHYQWSAATPAALAQLAPTPPANFRHLTQPPASSTSGIG
jgi:hypothetical protein